MSTRRLRLTACCVVVGMSVVMVARLPAATEHRRAATARNAVPPPEVACSACILVTESGRVLYRRAPHERRANASTTKMVTALVVVRRAELDETVTISGSAAATGGGGLDLSPGEQHSVNDLLYALILTSSNDAAVALAEHVAGSEAEFVELMNRTARRLGATDTNFVTAHGLDTPGHFSSARDLATIGAKLLSDPVLRVMAATPETVITGSSGTDLLENRNLLLETYPGALGIKTGYTAQAGNVLVAAARRKGRTLIAVAMGSVDATEDARRLLDYGWDRLAQSLLLRAGTTVGAVVLPSGQSIAAITTEEVRGFGKRNNVELRFEALSGGRAPGVGDAVGRVDVLVGHRTVATVDAVAADGTTIGGSSWPAGMLGAILKAAAGVTGRL